jgi:2-pyrone-4,6-dicarboxylate lactonase
MKTIMSAIKSIPPPRAHITTPRFRLPPGACDAHCHVFGPAGQFPYAEQRRYTPSDAPASALFALHAKLGVERVVLVQASVHGSDNRAMLDAIAQRPATMRGVAMVEPTITDDELRALHAGGVRAVRFNFVAHLGGAPDLGVVRTMAQRIKPLGWHLVLHLDAEDLDEYAAFVVSLPVPVVIDHMGRVNAAHGLEQPAFVKLLELMRHDHIWVKVSGSERISAHLSAVSPPYADAAPFARALIAAAPTRVLWGTDWPHPNVREMPDDGELVNLLEMIVSVPTAQMQLLVENPKTLYWHD